MSALIDFWLGSMIWVDFTIIGLMVFSTLTGLAWGSTKTCYSLCFWFLALWVALNFSKEFSLFIQANTHFLPATIAGSFAQLVLLTVLLGVSIGLLLGKSINKSNISIISRLSGIFLGLIHGAFFIVLLVIWAGLTPLPQDAWWRESSFLPTFQQMAVFLRDHVSSEIAKYINYQ